MKIIDIGTEKRLCLFAAGDIETGVELRYNYGDAADMLWRKKNHFQKPFNIKDVECLCNGYDPNIVKLPTPKPSQVLSLFKGHLDFKNFIQHNDMNHCKDGFEQNSINDAEHCPRGDKTEIQKVHVESGSSCGQINSNNGEDCLSEDRTQELQKVHVESGSSCDQINSNNGEDCLSEDRTQELQKVHVESGSSCGQINSNNGEDCLSEDRTQELQKVHVESGSSCGQINSNNGEDCLSEDRAQELQKVHVESGSSCDQINSNNGEDCMSEDRTQEVLPAIVETSKSCEQVTSNDHDDGYQQENGNKTDEEISELAEDLKMYKFIHDIPLGIIKNVMQQIIVPKLYHIFSGKIPCERHTRFKEGGIDRATLVMDVGFGVFSEEQENQITNIVLEEFCSISRLYFDYCMKVLLPEALAILYSIYSNTSILEANQILVRPPAVSTHSESEDEVFPDFTDLTAIPSNSQEFDWKDDLTSQENLKDETSSAPIITNGPIIDKKETESCRNECIDNNNAEIDMTIQRATTAKAVWAKVYQRQAEISNEPDSDSDSHISLTDDEQLNKKSEKTQKIKMKSIYARKVSRNKSWKSDVKMNNETEEVDDLKREIEILKTRLELAERAAERESIAIAEPFEETDLLSPKKSKIPRTQNSLSHSKILVNKRKKEQKERKLRSCVKQYVGSTDAVKPRYVSGNHRVFDIKCPFCDSLSSRLHEHLIVIHKMETKAAKMKESELRVMYLWASKDKHGIANPLPCEICNKWFLRLDNHLKGKHGFDRTKTASILTESRKKYWCSGASLKNSSTSITKDRETDNVTTTMGGSSYVPIGSIRITNSQREQWKLAQDEFTIFYDSAETLLDAFRAELLKKNTPQQSSQYKQFVELIWYTVDPEMTVLPNSALGNCLLVEDKYHSFSLKEVNEGGIQASTLRVRLVALKMFIKFLRRRHVYAGISRQNLTKLLEYVDDWNSDFTSLIAQRRTDLRKIKVKRLITPSHMIRYGRSSYVQSLIRKIDSHIKGKQRPTKRFCQQVRDYILCNLCIMNGLRASNIIELRVSDVEDATTNREYPGYHVFVNSTYKTSTIYGEKVIALPHNVFRHLEYYVKHCRPLLSSTSGDRLFVSSDADLMTHGAIGSALTASFKYASTFSKNEYDRVCPTRIRCACATFGCKVDGIDSGFFAKHFMKNKENTTNIHYNMYANHREALKLAMMIGDTFEVGGEQKKVEKATVDQLTLAIKKCEKSMPTKAEVASWIQERDVIEPKELQKILDMLDDVDKNSNPAKFFGGKKQVPSPNLTDETQRKTYSLRQNEHLKPTCAGDFQGSASDDENPDIGADEDDSSCSYASECESDETDGKPVQEEEKRDFNLKRIDDIISTRKHSRTTYLALTGLCLNLITRPDYENSFNIRTFTAMEVQECLNSDKFEDLLQEHDAEYWKYLVLKLREKYHGLKDGNLFKWNKWMADVNAFHEI